MAKSLSQIQICFTYKVKTTYLSADRFSLAGHRVGFSNSDLVNGGD